MTTTTNSPGRGARIDVEGISKSFGETRALAGVDMSVPAGTVQGLPGPNGAGKTTLVRILATLLAPDTGRARISGVDVQQDPDTVRSRGQREHRHHGMIPARARSLVQHRGEQFQQVTARIRNRDRYRPAMPARTRQHK
jgi:ABC-type multidrug transport system ATPase subunit